MELTKVLDFAKANFEIELYNELGDLLGVECYRAAFTEEELEFYKEDAKADIMQEEELTEEEFFEKEEDLYIKLETVEKFYASYDLVFPILEKFGKRILRKYGNNGEDGQRYSINFLGFSRFSNFNIEEW